MTKLTLLLIAIIFQGCITMVWQHPTKTHQTLSTEKYRCENDALSLYPPVFSVEQVSNGYRTPKNVNCRNSKDEVQCTTSGGDYVPPVMATVDANRRNREANVDSCLESLGWRYKPLEK